MIESTTADSCVGPVWFLYFCVLCCLCGVNAVDSCHGIRCDAFVYRSVYFIVFYGFLSSIFSLSC